MYFLKGNVYNIPVCLWLLDTYPFNPPICFVKPTSAMMIKTGKHIDANGKIYLPYLHEWKHVSLSFFFGSCLRTIFENFYYPYNIICCGLFVVANFPLLFPLLQPQSDLYGLIQVMMVVFGEEPPVFSRPTTQPPYQAFQAAGTPNRKLAHSIFL